MTNDVEIPEGIGPHEGKELELMLSGQKPLAFFSDTVPASIELPETEFQPYVDDGTFCFVEKIFKFPNDPDTTFRYLYYAISSEKWRIDELIEIFDAIHLQNKKATDDVERRIGDLLGYDEKDVETFIDWRRKFMGDC